MSATSRMRIETASLSDVGMVRRHNEDFYSEFEVGGRRLLVVADGMGGHKGGATASRVAVETIGEVFQTSDAEPAELLDRALTSANQRIYGMSMETAELRGMGTTVVALLFGPDDRAWVGHVGDSRAYRLRAGRLEALTADHSVVAEMERRGLLTAEEAAVHPRRNEILRSVGVEETVQVDVGELEVLAGDAYLLCSDGLSGMVKDAEIADVLQTERAEEAVKILVNLANDLGGTDNVTIQTATIISVLPGPATAGAPSTAGEPSAVAEGPHDRFRRRSGAAAVIAGLLVLGAALYLLTRG